MSLRQGQRLADRTLAAGLGLARQTEAAFTQEHPRVAGRRPGPSVGRQLGQVGGVAAGDVLGAEWFLNYVWVTLR